MTYLKRFVNMRLGHYMFFIALQIPRRASGMQGFDDYVKFWNLD